MNIEVITKEDLQVLKRELLEDLKQILAATQTKPNQWLKSADVRKMLNISPGTLQNLRIAGHLKPNKIGGSFYYALGDIENLLLPETKRKK